MSDLSSTQAKRVGWVLRGTRYSTSTLLVFVVLAERSNDRGSCWPSVSSIAEDSRCAERTVQYAIKQLVKDGWVKVERQQSDAGTNVYHLNLRRLERAHHEAQERRRIRYAANAAIELFVADLPVDNTEESVDSDMNSVHKGGNSCGNPHEKHVFPNTLRVQTTTPKGATDGSKGCKAFAPKPPEPQITPTEKSKRTFDGGGKFPVLGTVPTLPHRASIALRFMQAPP